jgi:serine/threonine protein kinase
MDYSEYTHCPNCFKPSQTALCPACRFDRNAYLQQEAASHHLPLFSRLDKGYILGRVLGEGSFAIVYAATRERDGLACAVKEYYPQDLAQRGLDGKTVNPKRNHEQLGNWQRRFEQEGELLRSCYDYPSVESGVVRYTALIKQHNTAYLVMERLTGYNLTTQLASQRILSGASICLWLKPLLETLQKLHAKDIYHRDISPNNIFLCAPNEPVLMDFGLAREGVRDAVLKSSTLGAGTFIAPEQLTGGYCDQRTDLYALGAVIYLCLLGEAPPPVEARRQGAPLLRLAQLDPLTQALQNVATHCLQLDLAMRPHNAGQLLAELSPYWLTQSPPSLETIIPGQMTAPYPATATYAPTVSGDYISAHQAYPPPPPPVAQANSHQDLGKLLLKWGLVVGLAYVGLTAYQNYAQEQEKHQKQDRQLFRDAKTIEDFKTYLIQCVICESKPDAENKIAELEKDAQTKLAQKQQKREEHAQYLKAKTVEELQAYIDSCVICQYKDKATRELKKKTAEAEAEAAQTAQDNEPSLWDTLAKPAVDALESVTQDGKAKAEAEAEAKLRQEADLKAKIEADTRAKLEAEYKAKADAEAVRAKTEAEIRAQMEKEVRDKAYQDAKAKLDAEMKAKADAEAKAKADAAAAQKAQMEADLTKLKAFGEAAVKVFSEPSK